MVFSWRNNKALKSLIDNVKEEIDEIKDLREEERRTYTSEELKKYKKSLRITNSAVKGREHHY